MGSTCNFECNQGYEIFGDSSRECENTHLWSGLMPKCTPTECPALDPPKNGLLLCTADRSYRSICQFKCNDGYELFGNNIMECTAEKKWNPEDIPECREIVCNVLPPLPNGNIKCSDENRHQSVCRFVCGEGYRIKGSRSSVCSTDGSWSAPMPICDQIICDELTPPVHGTKECSGEKFGEKCKFACDTGYDLSGSEQRTCQADGTWTGVPVHCTQASCGLLPSPRHGSVLCSDGGTFGSVCTFTCDQGYSLVGSEERACEADHAWSGSQPYCLQVTCAVLVPPANGYLSCSSGNLYNSICSFSCKSGFSLEGSTETKCDISGEWDNPEPSCSIVACSDPVQLDHGRTQCSDGSNYGSRCAYSCLLGYELEGSSQRECLDIGWSGKAPTCSLIRCARSSVPEHGGVSCTNRNKFNSQCTFTCDPGYVLLGPRERRCGADHEWSGSREPICELIRCGPLDAPFHGSIGCKNSDFYGSDCEFSCSRGYDLIGSNKRSCGVSQVWTGVQPKCRPITCGELAPPEYGSLLCSDADGYGSTCKFFCDLGFSLEGSKDRECADNGWTGEQPQCIEVRCGVLEVVHHGSTDCTDEDKFSSVCTNECESGFQLVGSRVRICESGGTWSGRTAKCSEVSCPPIELEPHTSSSGSCAKQPQNYGRVCTFFPDPGWEIVGARQVKCQGSGRWSEIPPTAELVKCGDLGEIAHGTVACSFGSTFGSVCSYQCNLGYTPIGATEIQCGRDRSWNDFPPFCQIKRCVALTEPSNGRMFCVSDNTFGSECAFSCNMGYMLRGPGSRTCGADQRWSGAESTCVAVQCEAINEPDYGNMICSKSRNFGSVCTITCDSGFDLLGPRQRACGAEGRWSGLPPNCQLIHCGPLTAPQHGNVSCSLLDQFGSQCNYDCNYGYKLVGSNNRVCQESGAWTGVQPVCELVQCRPLASPENGFVACSSGNDYNSHCQYLCTVGFELVGNDQRLCKADGRWTGDRPHCDQVKYFHFKTI